MNDFGLYSDPQINCYPTLFVLNSMAPKYVFPTLELFQILLADAVLGSVAKLYDDTGAHHRGQYIVIINALTWVYYVQADVLLWWLSCLHLHVQMCHQSQSHQITHIQ
jgi:hypothetical protein